MIKENFIYGKNESRCLLVRKIKKMIQICIWNMERCFMAESVLFQVCQRQDGEQRAAENDPSRALQIK